MVRESKSDGIEPTEIKPTEITPTEIKPTEIKPTEITPTEIKPTEIKPTEIKPTEIKPTEIYTGGNTTKSSVQRPNAPFSHARATGCFITGCVSGVITLIVGLSGLIFLMPATFMLMAIMLGLFFIELKRLEVTQEALDEWKKQILAKFPNYSKAQLDTMTTDLYNKNILNKFSYWTHTFKVSFNKVLACIMLPVAVVSAGVGVVVPLTSGGAFGGGDVVGVYVQAEQHATQNNIEQVGKTAWKFDKSGNAYYTGYYDGNQTVWSKQGTYKKDGSKVTISGGYFTIKNNGKQLVGSDGSYWIRV